MKVLIVANYRHGHFAPFIIEQVDALKAKGIDIEYFPILGKGMIGYLGLRKSLIKKIKEFKPDIVHAHYGLSGLLANLQRIVPVVTTYHGSDINIRKIRIFSKLSMCLSAYNIFVSHKNINIAKPRKYYSLLPCGVDLDNFKHIDKTVARKMMGYEDDVKLVLFAGSFNNAVKNAGLAKEAVALLDGVKLIELKGYNREQVNILMHAVDACLMTSFTEGSPQFIKEAMACNCPIVSTDVGDVREIIASTDNCYIIRYDSIDCSEKLLSVLSLNNRKMGRDRIEYLGLDNKIVAHKLNDIYLSLITNKIDHT